MDKHSIGMATTGPGDSLEAVLKKIHAVGERISDAGRSAESTADRVIGFEPMPPMASQGIGLNENNINDAMLPTIHRALDNLLSLAGEASRHVDRLSRL